MKLHTIICLISFGAALLFVPLFWITDIIVFGFVGYVSMIVGSIFCLVDAVVRARDNYPREPSHPSKEDNN